MSLYSFLRKFFKDEAYEKYKHDFETVSNIYHELLTSIENEQVSNDSETYWNNKHTKKDVYYLGRYLPVKDDFIECDVKDFITPNDAKIKELVKDNNLTVSNPNFCNADIVKIYQFCRLGSTYNYDQTLFGKTEVWLFPFEFLYLNSVGDCEDNSHYIASMLICAGVPRFRVRVVCGMCNLGGHSTVYVLGDDLTTWYHLNSTGGYEYFNDLTLFPTSKDASDGLGISDVWFSFNDEYSFSDFENKTTSSSFNKELKGKVLIKEA